jgi:ribosomal protein L35
MPKLKTRTGAQKRITISKRGKLIRRGQNNRHLSMGKTHNQKRRMSAPMTIYKAFAKKLKHYI